MSLSERYSIKSMAKSRGVSISEFKKMTTKENRVKSNSINFYIDRSYSLECAKLFVIGALCEPYSSN